MNILLTNDDGISAPGIDVLYDALKARRHDIVQVAPARQQSGIGHAFTFCTPLYYEKIHGKKCDVVYAVDGTPADCVKFAMCQLLDTPPRAVVAGMNVGENSGISGFYSGTVAAAREGAFWHIPSFAFSVCDNGEQYLERYAEIAAGILESLLKIDKGFRADEKNHVYYNINFPSCDPDESRGIKITRQSLAFFDDRYRREKDDCGREGYVIYGEKKDIEQSDEFDSRALLNNYITITPLHFDATAHEFLPCLDGLERQHKGAH